MKKNQIAEFSTLFLFGVAFFLLRKMYFFEKKYHPFGTLEKNSYI